MCIGVRSPTGMRQPTPPQIQSDSPCPNGQWLLSGVSVVLPLPKMETVVGLVLCRSRTAAKSSCVQHTRVSTDRTPPHALAFQSHFCAVPWALVGSITHALSMVEHWRSLILSILNTFESALTTTHCQKLVRPRQRDYRSRGGGSQSS